MINETRSESPTIRVLVVDDEAPSLADLVYELRTFAEIAEIVEADSAASALRALRASTFDVVFLDVRMPGLDGLELGRTLNQFKLPPPIVYVSAYESHAFEAFDVDAVDYLLKPVRRERLTIALTKALARRPLDVMKPVGLPAPVPAPAPAPAPVPTPVSTPVVGTDTTANIANESRADAVVASSSESDERGQFDNQFDNELISLEVGGRIRMIHRSDVLFVSASGDYVRLHVGSSSVLVRAAMATLEERWARVGFVRIHRSYLVALAHISEVRVERGRGYVVAVGDRLLPVSRRLGPQLKARLIEDAARRGPR
jgi:DNA-binding LytR/AlgR family response regulator